MTRPQPTGAPAVILREQVRPRDPAAVAALVQETGFFTDAESAVARELVETTLAQGPAAGYHFLFAESTAALAGYACFGPIPAAPGRFDLYWIAVSRHAQRGGIGRLLLQAAERVIAGQAGRRIYIETSSRALYAPTHRFYEAAGYLLEARLRDFYADGDDKLIYVKAL